MIRRWQEALEGLNADQRDALRVYGTDEFAETRHRLQIFWLIRAGMLDWRPRFFIFGEMIIALRWRGLWARSVIRRGDLQYQEQTP